jgi:hypothetical protein
LLRWLGRWRWLGLGRSERLRFGQGFRRDRFLADWSSGRGFGGGGRSRRSGGRCWAGRGDLHDRLAVRAFPLLPRCRGRCPNRLLAGRARKLNRRVRHLFPDLRPLTSDLDLLALPWRGDRNDRPATRALPLLASGRIRRADLLAARRAGKLDRHRQPRCGARARPE